MRSNPYCRARVGELVPSEEGLRVEFINTELADYEQVVAFLRSTYDRFATQLADRNSRRVEHEARNLSRIGGFGVRLTNRFDGEIEVGVGRKLWLLLLLRPGPMRAYFDQADQDGTLDFYLDGWHHTEMQMSGLVSRDECLRCVKHWLETDQFPDAT